MVEFKIEKNIAVLNDRNTKGWAKELNLVAWGGNPAKLDIRDWDAEHLHMSKGITLTEDEAEALKSALTAWLTKGTTNISTTTNAIASVSNLALERLEYVQKYLDLSDEDIERIVIALDNERFTVFDTTATPDIEYDCIVAFGGAGIVIDPYDFEVLKDCPSRVLKSLGLKSGEKILDWTVPDLEESEPAAEPEPSYPIAGNPNMTVEGQRKEFALQFGSKLMCCNNTDDYLEATLKTDEGYKHIRVEGSEFGSYTIKFM